MSQTKTQLVEGLNINTSAPADALAVDNSGNVGIGVTSPSGTLHVKEDTNKNLVFNGSITEIGSVTGFFALNDAGSALVPFGMRAEDIRFATGSAERARIDSSGRLLVGTSTTRTNFQLGTPTTQYETAISSFNQGLSIINNGGSSVYFPILTLGVTRGTSIGSNTAITGANAGLGRVNFAGADGTNLLTGASITALSDGTWTSSDAPTRLEFSTTQDGDSSPTERMRIANNGNLGTFNNNTSDSIYISNNAAAGTSLNFIYAFHSASGMFGGTNSFRVATNGNVYNTNGTYTTISDERLKENIIDASSQWQDIRLLRIRNFNYRKDTGNETHRQIGLIAQELEQISPGLVTAIPFEKGEKVFDADGNELSELKTVNMTVLYMKAVKALQEAMERIEQLESSNADLLARVTALEAS